MTVTDSNTIAQKDIDRFMGYVRVAPGTEAWLWTGGILSSGYGGFWYQGRTVGAHRFSWMAFRGPIPYGMFVCHKFEDLGRHNVNPSHLFLGDHASNMADCATKDRTLIGANNHQSVLSDSDVLAIAVSTERYAVLSDRFGVSETIISKIKRGLLWQRLTGIPTTQKHSLANKSGYIGVRFKKNGWEASIGWKADGKYQSKYLGRFQTAEQAARVYDAAAIERHGPLARLNFPN